jgi:hypothetical protein
MSAFSQEEIADKVYLYGNVRYKLQSQVLIKFPEADPKTELKTIKYFEERGVNAVSWNALFLPGADYSEEDFYRIVFQNQIKTIVIIQVTGTSSRTSTYATAYNSSFAYASSSSYTSAMSLQLSVYTDTDDFVMPTGVLKSAAVGNWGAAGTKGGIATKIIRRMLYGLDSEFAFF